jgi:hypothetical protein
MNLLWGSMWDDLSVAYSADTSSSTTTSSYTYNSDENSWECHTQGACGCADWTSWVNTEVTKNSSGSRLSEYPQVVATAQAGYGGPTDLTLSYPGQSTIKTIITSSDNPPVTDGPTTTQTTLTSVLFGCMGTENQCYIDFPSPTTTQTPDGTCTVTVFSTRNDQFSSMPDFTVQYTSGVCTSSYALVTFAAFSVFGMPTAPHDPASLRLALNGAHMSPPQLALPLQYFTICNFGYESPNYP